MAWKNLSYWVKGGVIGLLIILFLFIIAFIYNLIFPPSSGTEWGRFGLVWGLLLMAYLPLYWIFGTQIEEIGGYGTMIFAIVFYFIIGAIIGWIVGKIRNKTNLKTRAK